MAPTQTIRLSPNIPVQMAVKYIDIWPNDTTKNQGKGYGASLALKGIVDGEEVKVYPKGFLDRNLETLMAAGVIAPGDYSDDPAEHYSIPVASGDVTLCMTQLAGQRYAEFTVRAAGAPAPVATTAPARANGAREKVAVSAGGPLPWETEQAADEARFVASAKTPAPAPATPSPRGNGADVRPSFADMTAKYRECVDAAVICAADLSKLGIPPDASAVAAMAATLFIQRNQRGI